MPPARMHRFSGSNSPDRLFARKILQESIDALAAKRMNNESLMRDMELPLTKLLFCDCMSVIQDCIEIIRETAREHGITMP